MGIDLFYYAIPNSSPALERARQDPRLVWDLDAFARGIHHPSSPPSQDAQRAQLQDEARQAAREHPGIEKREFYWKSRAFDAALFFLSERRRTSVENGNWDADDWATGAIFGREFIHKEVWTVSGFPVRYNSPARLREYAEQIRGITKDGLRNYFDPARMVEVNVYKCGGKRNGFDLWMWPDIEEWRAFLVSMLDFPDEGLICSMG